MNHEFCEERGEENTESKRCSSGYQGSKEVDRVGGGGRPKERNARSMQRTARCARKKW
jgi:hypothetical protein